MKVEKNTFTSLLEKVLVDIWGGYGEHLSPLQIKNTRAALSNIRRVYRYRSEHGAEHPTRINYQFKKNRAGYLAAFGEKHAYLSYLHLKRVKEKNPEAIPKPRGKRNELVVTSLGAGACIELFGICLYYLSDLSNQPLHLKLNAIEKQSEWNSSQHIVFTRVLKSYFPKVDVDPTNIEADLREDVIHILANKYDNLISTDILLIYNVINEISSSRTNKVWRNIRYLLDTLQRPTLILMMEPSAPRAEPRIYSIKEQILQQSELIDVSKEEVFHFIEEPVCIEKDNSSNDLNSRLFGYSKNDGLRPEFNTFIERAHMSSFKKPDSPITIEQIAQQLSRLGTKRVRKGSSPYLRPKIHKKDGEQYTFVSVSDNWILKQ